MSKCNDAQPQKGGENTYFAIRVNPLVIMVGTLLFLQLAVIPCAGQQTEQTDRYKQSQERSSGRLNSSRRRLQRDKFDQLAKKYKRFHAARSRRLIALRRRLAWNKFGQNNGHRRSQDFRSRRLADGHGLGNLLKRKFQQIQNPNKLYEGTTDGTVVEAVDLKMDSPDSDDPTSHRKRNRWDNIHTTLTGAKGEEASVDAPEEVEDAAKLTREFLAKNPKALFCALSVPAIGIGSFIAGACNQYDKVDGALVANELSKLGYYFGFLLCFGALAAFVLFFNRSCLGSTFAVTTMVSSSAFCAYVGNANWDVSPNLAKDGVLAQIISSNEAVIVASFAACFSVGIGLFMLCKQFNPAGFKGSPWKSYATAVVGIAALTCMGGGFTWMAVGDDMHNLVDKSGKPEDFVDFNGGVPTTFIGIGLIVGMSIFLLFAGCSAGHDKGGVHVYGFYDNNMARMGISTFFALGGGATFTTFGIGCTAGSLSACGFTLGIVAACFPIIYLLFFRWQGGSGGSAALGNGASAWKVATVLAGSAFTAGMFICFSTKVPLAAEAVKEAGGELFTHNFVGGYICMGLLVGLVAIVAMVECLNPLNKPGGSLWSKCPFAS